MTSVPTLVIHTVFIAVNLIVSLCSDQSSIKWVNHKRKRVHNQITRSNWSAKALLELCNERKEQGFGISHKGQAFKTDNANTLLHWHIFL